MKEKTKIVEKYVEYEVRGIKVGFNEKRKINIETNEEIYDEEIMKENDIELYDKYKEKVGLLTSKEIKEIRKKYEISQAEFADMLGMGEVTITRYENGTIQTRANNIIIESARDPKNMLKYVSPYRESMKKERYFELINLINKLIENEKHKVLNLDFDKYKNLNFNTEKIEKICEYILNKQNEEFVVTQLSLQKLLYYIQGICLILYNKVAFANNIEAWEYGPAIRKVYDDYKEYGKYQLRPQNKVEGVDINKGLKEIIDDVINSYGKYSAGALVDLTHKEDPWLNAYESGKNVVISAESIKRYFDVIYRSK